MKILSVRGENLASLEEFQIRFDERPLKNTGVFAIVGPTGAGKSTLLDAICVALYGETPRTAEGQAVWVGQEGDKDALSSRDARWLLRRGTSRAMAEVRFIGGDGRTYRAQWEVRRAHDRPDGALQPPTMRLYDEASGTLLGTKLSDTLALIAEKVGLSFEQFRRAVLLAQGDFATFLKSNAKARAALLEELTGQHIYTRVSKKAHERARDAKNLLIEREREEDALRRMILPETDVINAETQILETEAQLRLLEQQLSDAEAAIHWHHHQTALLKQVEEAQEALSTELQIAAQAQELSQTLAAVEAAEPCRAPIDAFDRATEELNEARNRQNTAQAQEAQGREAQEAMRLALQNATALEAAAEAQESIKAQHALEAAIAADQQRQEQAQHWASQHPELQALAAEAPSLRLRLAELVALDQHDAQPDPLSDLLDTPDRWQVEAAEATLQGLRDALQSLELQLAPVPQLLTTQHQSSERLETLRSQLHELDEALRLEAEVATQRARASSGRAEAEAAQTASVAAVKQLESLAAQLSEARHHRDQFRATLDLAVHRQELREHQPCPLCGGKEHPYHPQAPILDSLLQNIDLRISELDQQLREQERNHAAARTRMELARRQAEEAERLASALRHQAQDRRRGARIAADAEAAIRREAADLPAQLEAISAQLESLRGLQVQRDRLIASIDTYNSQIQSSQHYIDLQQRRERLVAELPEHLKRLLGPLDNPSEAINHLENQLSLWENHLRGLQDIATRLAVQGPALIAARLRAEAALSRRDEALQVMGSPLPDPLPALADAQAARSEASQALLNTQTAAAAAARALQDAQSEARRREARLQHAQSVLNRNLGDRSEADVRALLARGPVWAATTRAALASQEARRLQAQTRLQERLDAQKLAETERPALALEDAEQIRRQGSEARRAAAAIVAEQRERLRQSTERQAQLDVLLPLLAVAKAEHGRWQAVDALIGSAKGEEFRSFAQGLTLDVLIVHANKRLALLSQRYRLERAPNPKRDPEADMNLQVVDLYMGQQARPVSSLSGGELFLVSLALALGLASLASERTPIATFFIDEGFGSLDTRTLDIALSALEALAAEERQVGIVSHVTGLNERVGVQVKVQKVGVDRSVVSVLER